MAINQNLLDLNARVCLEEHAIVQGLEQSDVQHKKELASSLAEFKKLRAACILLLSERYSDGECDAASLHAFYIKFEEIMEAFIAAVQSATDTDLRSP